MTDKDKPFHPSTADLILHMDGELESEFSRQVKVHLRSCSACATELQKLRDGVAAYDDYRQATLPQLDLPAWSAVQQREPALVRRPWLWWSFAGLAAAATLLFFAASSLRGPATIGDEQQATEILASAEARPVTETGSLAFTSAGRRWLKTADSVQAQRVHALFVQSRYSWDRPLSARSFATWRNTLPQKRDHVSLVRGAQGERTGYRVRTSTAAGVLRAVSLTLQADTYHATDAAFQFQGEALMELSEAETTPPPKQTVAAPTPSVTPKEIVVGPEEELRVLAALSNMGVDAEEPLEVSLDAAHRQVTVTGFGLTARRQQEIAAAVANLPAVVLRFNTAQARQSTAARSSIYTAGADSAFRHKLEAGAGGVRQWQDLADSALDGTSRLFARTHALLQLAQEFGPKVEGELTPASRELLHGLQQRQAGAIQFAARQLQEVLKPLLPPSAPVTGAEVLAVRPWQNGALHLNEEAKMLDELLDRLLAGSVDDATGTRLQRELPARLARLEALVREQLVARAR